MAQSADTDLAVTVSLASPEATERCARAIAELLAPGDVLLLDGSIGAGKSHFCRAAIRQLLAREDREEDIPSPTFTLVQTYHLGDAEIWHADLYRLTDPVHLVELGLDEAFETAITLVEWPDRLGDMAPPDALHISLASGPAENARTARITATDPKWNKLLPLLAAGGPRVSDG